jgi:Ca-activated chloride channel family protein
MIVTFDYEVRVDAPLTSDKKLLEKAIRDVGIGEIPGTSMRDAVADTVEKHLARETGRKAILIFTDGQDFGSYADGSELLRSIEESDVMIFPVFYETTMQRAMTQRRGPLGRDFPRRPRNAERARRREAAANERAREYLEEMAALTAGRFHDQGDRGLDEIFVSIADELRRQYRLGFYPDESENDGAVRSIKVRVNRASVSVRARTGYRLRK